MTEKDLKSALLNGDIEAIMDHLRRMANLPGVLLNVAEKIYRLYKLNKLDHDLQSLREVTANTLVQVAELAARLERGDVRQSEMEKLIAQHERSIADINARLGLTPVE